MKKALIIVDVQNDFTSGGTLAVKGSDQIIPAINELMTQFDLVVASQDWHPETTAHFDKWPKHCVAESRGAAFHASLDQRNIQEVFLKGTSEKDDGYSAFEASNMDLAHYLKEQEVDIVFICGIALDYCVKSTALDSAKNGFETYIVENATAVMSASEGEIKGIKDEIRKGGVNIISEFSDWHDYALVDH